MGMTNTQLGLGIRHNFKTLGERNFESTGVQYACNRPGLYFQGSTYNVGDHLTYDVGGTSYSAVANYWLQLYFNAGWVIPLT